MKKVIKKTKTKKETFTKDEVGVYDPVDFRDLHKELMKNPEFVKAYNNLAPEYALIEAIINARINKNISQKMLAKRLGTGQSAVSRLESGTYNPSLKFLQKLAKALETDLTITFSK